MTCFSASFASNVLASCSKTLQKFAEIRAVFAENCAHFSLCNAPFGHKKHSDRCKPSAASSRWPRACFTIVARAWCSDFASKSTQNRAVFAEKSAQNRRGLRTKRAPRADEHCQEVHRDQRNTSHVVAQVLRPMRACRARKLGR